ncbi:MAG TPA: suppressor of fused domain protein [Tepidisphaeraceae bacterium]|nr:suppressor of fused domain protein [Tepidisphaeraceae bacterium]
MPGKIPCTCGKQYTWTPDRAGKRARCKACGAVVAFPAKDPDDELLIGPEPEYEQSPSGARVYRHEPRTTPPELAIGDDHAIGAISDHIERHIGPVAGVFHEIVSDLVHIDIHMVAPTEERPWHTLVTSGMSDRPMTVPDPEDPELRELRYAELLICLPPDWPMEQEQWADDDNFWPIRWLKQVARLPHEYETWVGAGHTIPNGDPAEPVATNTKLCCMLLMPPVLVSEGFHRLAVSDDKAINFYALFPLYQEEMELKLNKGLDPLVERFAKAEVSELLDVGRKNTCGKRFGLF